MKNPLMIVLISSMAAAAGAQTPVQVPEPRAEAHALFLRAGAHIEVGRFAEATHLLRESIRVFPTGAAAFNLGVALRGVGDILAASEQFRALESGFYGPLAEAQSTQVRELLAEAESEIATLVVRACGAEDLQIRIDGELHPTSLDCERIEVRLNPGVHHVTASAPTASTVSQRVTLTGGERLEVDLQLTPRLDPISELRESRRWYQRPWLWVTVGVLVTGAAVGAGLAASADSCEGVNANLCL